ncbi:hypothetical protein [Parendozoicomonas sp. Alg238-R29]|uniref:hypothetical protein n=1 Tax=Parendozoicomonas sp. Alg238-R29 TaxID=2993446 RepID=UPI00248DAEED|nr:hypothetical protein [Parendozoicomonas sp. Alg238-R29]
MMISRQTFICLHGLLTCLLLSGCMTEAAKHAVNSQLPKFKIPEIPEELAQSEPPPTIQPRPGQLAALIQQQVESGGQCLILEVAQEHSNWLENQ